MEIDLNTEFIKFNFSKIGKFFIERFFKKTQIEQIAFRMYLCKNCLETKKCKHCSCNPIDTIIEPFSCNEGKVFPNFMQEKQWENFKQQHNIVVKNELQL